MKKAIFLCVLSAVLITGGIAAGAADSADETAMQPEEEIDVTSIDWSQIDDIVTYAEEHGLTIGVDYGDERVDYNETVAAAYAPEEFERERAEIEALLSELETGEVITYYPDTGNMVIE